MCVLVSSVNAHARPFGESYIDNRQPIVGFMLFFLYLFAPLPHFTSLSARHSRIALLFFYDYDFQSERERLSSSSGA